MTREDQVTVLEHCRRHGIWIIADEVYERLYFGDAVAPRRRSSTSPTATSA